MKKFFRHLHNDVLRMITLVAACAFVLIGFSEEPIWKIITVCAISGAWMLLFFHANAGYFGRKQMYTYYSTMRPVGIGTYPSDRKVLAVHNFNEPIQVEEIHHHAWGIIGFEGKLTAKEQDIYDLVPCEHPERLEEYGG